MTVKDYKEIVRKNSFEEYPYILTGNEIKLSSFIEYDEIELDLKIYLCKLIICRCFPPVNKWNLPEDSNWFISNFFKTFDNDKLKPWLTITIKEASEMILSQGTFTKGIIGTTFMFGVLEFYAKYEIGFRPNDYDFFDSAKKDYFKSHTKKYDITIKDAFEFLQKEDKKIASVLNEIDKHNINRLNEVGIEEKKDGWIKIKVSDRLSLARNTMLHGENHSFYDMGQYLLMLYILFYLHTIEKK